MSVNQDTAHTKALRSGLEHLDAGWVRWLDILAGKAKAKNGLHFDLFTIFRGKGKPLETEIKWRQRDYTGDCPM